MWSKWLFIWPKTLACLFSSYDLCICAEKDWITFLWTPSQNTINNIIQTLTWFRGMFRVVEHEHVTRGRLSGDDAGVLWHVTGAVHLSLVVYLYLDLYLPTHGAKAAKFCKGKTGKACTFNSCIVSHRMIKQEMTIKIHKLLRSNKINNFVFHKHNLSILNDMKLNRLSSVRAFFNELYTITVYINTPWVVANVKFLWL